MVYSVGNIDNLRYLYLDCAEGIAQVENVHEREVEGKYRFYFNTLYQDIKDIVDTTRWVNKGLLQAPQSLNRRVAELVLNVVSVGIPIAGIVEGMHNVAETGYIAEKLAQLGLSTAHQSHFRLIQEAIGDVRGDMLPMFIKSIAQDLTYRFRHELSLLSRVQCVELAKRHYEQVKACLEQCAETPNSNVTMNDLRERIIDFVDPDPKKEIENRIKAYVERRDSIFFRSENYSREVFLIDFICHLKNDDTTPITFFITQIGLRVFFRNDWHFWKKNRWESLRHEFPLLSVRNPFLLKTGDDVSLPQKNRWRFNNPFFTAWTHYPLREVAKDIVLLLMRLQISQVAAQQSNKRAVEMIHFIAYPEEKSMYRIAETVCAAMKQHNMIIDWNGKY